MEKQEMFESLDAIARQRTARRRFLSQAGMLSLGAAATTFALGARTARAQESPAERAQNEEQAKDTVTEIFTAALIAEDLATTFYYNGLIGPVINDPNLAGSGTAADPSPSANPGNVNYLQAALTEEISHANLLRSLLGISGPAKDPVQMFYFPDGSFETLAAFTSLLNALENAFIGAYLNAIQEFATKSAARARDEDWCDGDGKKYTARELDYFAKVSATIMGIESEHRVLGRVISNSNPANNLAYEQTDGLNAVYNGPNSAVAALTPFLAPGSGLTGYSFAAALAGQAAVSLPASGAPPAF